MIHRSHAGCNNRGEKQAIRMKSNFASWWEGVTWPQMSLYSVSTAWSGFSQSTWPWVRQHRSLWSPFYCGWCQWEMRKEVPYGQEGMVHSPVPVPDLAEVALHQSAVNIPSSSQGAVTLKKQFSAFICNVVSRLSYCRACEWEWGKKKFTWMIKLRMQQLWRCGLSALLLVHCCWNA